MAGVIEVTILLETIYTRHKLVLLDPNPRPLVLQWF